MENNDKKTDNATDLPQAIEDRIFSQDEIRDIVKGFIAAYLRGDVAITFKSAEEFMTEAKVAGRKMDLDNALALEISSKQPFYNLVSICTGSKEASPVERQKAICDLFDAIVMLRSSDRLKGVLMAFGAEKRIVDIEEAISEIRKNILELMIYYRSVVEGSREKGS